jgi:hypothetical protein
VRICIYTLLGASGTAASGHHDNNEQKPVTRPAFNLEGRPEYRSREPQRFYSLRQKTMLQEVGRRLNGSQISKRMEKSKHWAQTLWSDGKPRPTTDDSDRAGHGNL